MTSPEPRLCLYRDGDPLPGEVLSDLGSGAREEAFLDTFRLALASGSALDGGQADPGGRHWTERGLAWAWRAGQESDRDARAVVMGPGLTGKALAAAVDGIHSQGQLVSGGRLLSASLPAVELSLVGPPVAPVALTRATEGAAEAAEVDLAILPPRGDPRSWGLVMMDMDSTLLANECIDEIADHAGRKEEVAAITERAMAGELDFKDSLRERVRMLEGLPEDVLETAYRERIRPNPGAQRLLETLRGMGVPVAVVSGGFTFFTDRIQRDLGVDYAHANVLETAGGHLTGEVKGEVVDGAVKAATLRDLWQRLDLPRERVIAMGDGANDLPMIAEAGMGLAYHAKPRVRYQAPYNLTHSSLDGLLYLLGLSDAEIEAYREPLRPV